MASETNVPTLAVDVQPRARRVAARWAIGLALSATVTAAAICYSQQSYRLLLPPTYDDVSYFTDALDRLARLRTGGWSIVVHDYVDRPPHAPFSTYGALLGFALFGIEDWVPYAVNGVLLLALVAFVDSRFRSGRPLLRAGAALFALMLPLTVLTVMEYRPDLACGLSIAMGVVSGLGGRWRGSPKVPAVSGAFFGLALLVKPAMFVLALPLAALTALLAVLVELLPDVRARIALLAGRVAVFGATCVGLALPHFAASGSHYPTYFRRAILAARKPIPDYPGDWTVQVRFFLDGQGGRQFLAHSLYLLAGIAVIAAAVELRRSDTEGRLRELARWCVLAAALAIPAVSPVKNPFFGTAFYWLLALLAIEGIHGLARSWPRLAAPVLILLGAAMGVATFGLGELPRWGSPHDPAIVRRAAFIQEVYGAVAERRSARVFLTGSGWLNRGVLSYLALRNGRQALVFWDIALSDDVGQHAAEMDRADLVIAAEPDSLEIPGHLPSTRILGETLALVRSRDDFREVASFLTVNGKRFFLFERVRRLASG